MPQKRHLAYSSMSLLDFQARFPSERACQDYLFSMRFPNGFICPKCSSSAVGFISSRSLWQCKSCRMQISLTAGTAFHRTRTPLYLWFWAVFLVAKDKRGHSALQLSKELGLPYDRSWLMLHKLRAAMANRDRQYRLQGTLELDEAYFGAPDAGKIRGRSTKRPKALIAVSVSPSDKPLFARFKIVRRLDHRTVMQFAKNHIEPGSHIQTDGLRAYTCLTEKYVHIPTVAEGKPKDTLLRWAHITISNAKAFIEGTFHGLDAKHLQRYLDEFCYRFNRRYREHELFDRLLTACCESPPLFYDELTR